VASGFPFPINGGNSELQSLPETARRRWVHFCTRRGRKTSSISDQQPIALAALADGETGPFEVALLKFAGDVQNVDGLLLLVRAAVADAGEAVANAVVDKDGRCPRWR